MPDKWEYPWFAAWDLAFHAVALAFVDPDFAREQLELMLRDRYQHPNGQLPAYEWNFDDVNPPVHAWAALFNYRLNRDAAWATTRSRSSSARSTCCSPTSPGGSTARTATGATCSRAASWASTTSASSIAARRCRRAATWNRPTAPPGWRSTPRTCWTWRWSWRWSTRPTRTLAIKFYEHVICDRRRHQPHRRRTTSLWDEEDGFFYDVLRVPGTVHDPAQGALDRRPAPAVRGHRLPPGGPARSCPRFMERVQLVQPEPPRPAGQHQPARARRAWAGGYMLSLLDERQAAAGAGAHAGSGGVPGRPRHPLAVALPPRPPVRLQRRAAGVPGRLSAGRVRHRHVRRQLELARADLGADQRPASSAALLQLYAYYGDDFQVECPTGSGQHMTLYEVAQELANRLAGDLPARPRRGAGRSTAARRSSSDDPHWRDNVLFYEYFHGDNGAGLGASHQTGWTGAGPGADAPVRAADARR